MSTTLTTVSNDDLRQVGKVETLSAAATLTAEDSGKLLILSAAAGAQVTLPAVATSAGHYYKFVVGAAFATTAWTIKAATSVIQGGVIVNSVNVSGANENTITFAHAAEKQALLKALSDLNGMVGVLVGHAMASQESASEIYKVG